MNDIETCNSLLGALLVAEGLVAPEQLSACLLLQQHDYAHLSLEEILLRCGYISAEELENANQILSQMQDSLTSALEAQVTIPADLSVLVIAGRQSEPLRTLLSRLGASVRFAQAAPCDLAGPRPDLVLVDSGKVQCCAELPEDWLIELLPDFGRYLSLEAVPAGVRRLLERFVQKARVERARLDEQHEVRQRDLELHVLTMVARSITSAASPQQLLTQLMELVRDLMQIEAATLFRLDGLSQRLVFEVVLGPNQADLSQKSLPSDHGIAGWVVQHGEPLIIPDVRRDPRFAGMTDRSTGFQTRSMLCVPVSALGKTRGVLQLINKREGEFNEHDLQLLRIVASFGGLLLAARSQPGLRPVVVRERERERELMVNV